MIARKEREREEIADVLTNDDTWRRRWPHNSAQLMPSMVLQWGDCSEREDESLEPGGCGR
jgi:hypothetical protein